MTLLKNIEDQTALSGPIEVLEVKWIMRVVRGHREL